MVLTGNQRESIQLNFCTLDTSCSEPSLFKETQPSQSMGLWKNCQSVFLPFWMLLCFLQRVLLFYHCLSVQGNRHSGILQFWASLHWGVGHVHHPYNCTVDLIPRGLLPSNCLSHLLHPEREAMGKYIRDFWTAGIIWPFFFSYQPTR